MLFPDSHAGLFLANFLLQPKITGTQNDSILNGNRVLLHHLTIKTVFQNILSGQSDLVNLSGQMSSDLSQGSQRKQQTDLQICKAFLESLWSTAVVENALEFIPVSPSYSYLGLMSVPQNLISHVFSFVEPSPRQPLSKTHEAVPCQRSMFPVLLDSVSEPGYTFYL